VVRVQAPTVRLAANGVVAKADAATAILKSKGVGPADTGGGAMRVARPSAAHTAPATPHSWSTGCVSVRELCERGRPPRASENFRGKLSRNVCETCRGGYSRVLGSFWRVQLAIPHGEGEDRNAASTAGSDRRRGPRQR
jgi:hypothetical protein